MSQGDLSEEAVRAVELEKQRLEMQKPVREAKEALKGGADLLKEIVRAAELEKQRLENGLKDV